MDIFNKAVAQLSDLFRSMTPGARITAALLLAVVVISLGYLFRSETTSADTYLMNGESLSAGDLHAAAAAFGKAHLEGYEIRARRSACPAGSRPPIWRLWPTPRLCRRSGPLRRMNSRPAAFGSHATAGSASHGITLQEELSLDFIRSMPGVDRAMVILDTETKPGFGQEVVKTASVSVKAIGSGSLEEKQVETIRYLVDSAVAGLKPDAVIVADVNTGQVYHAPGKRPRRPRQLSRRAAKVRGEIQPRHP